MSIGEIVLLISAGAFASAINSVVGGGTFFSFPLLLALGLPPVAANATSTVALWPGSLMASRAYAPELKRVRARLPVRALVALAGGTLGAVLLLASGDALFFALVPWLLAVATLLFAFRGQIVRCMARLGQRVSGLLALALEFVFAVYGGYFGAGIGILLMAAFAVAGEQDLQLANAQKNLLAMFINGAAVAIFVVQGAVIWPVAASVMAGALAGGYFGARAARRIPARWLHICVISVGTLLAMIYFRSAYFG